MNFSHYLDQTLLPLVGSQAWIDKKAIAPAPILPKEWRPTSEPLIPPVYDEDRGPSKGYQYLMYLALIIELIAGSIIQSNEATNVEDGGDREIPRSALSSSCAHILLVAAETELISDLAIASLDSTTNVSGVCPNHGTTCTKGLCQWRDDNAREK